MSHEFHPHVQSIDSEAVSLVVCTICNTVVAQDHGKPEDVPVIATQVSSHVTVLPIFSSTPTPHEILTVDVKSATSRPGLHIEMDTTAIKL